MTKEKSLGSAMTMPKLSNTNQKSTKNSQIHQNIPQATSTKPLSQQIIQTPKKHQ
jgi:hypothetical protein